MGMTYTFKDANGNMIFSVEGVNSVTGNDISLESMAYDIGRKGNEICNSLERINFISDTRAMEALGYEKGAGFKANVKAVSNAIWEKIKKFFGRIRDFFSGIINKISMKFNDSAAKRAAAKVVKKMENPTDMDKDVELAKVLAVINSSDMGEFVVATKYKNELTKIIDSKMDNISKYTENDMDKLVKRMEGLKSEVSRVSNGEKRKAAINFYHQISSSGIENYKNEMKDNKARAEGMLRAVEGSKNRTTGEEELKKINRWYGLETAAYGFLVREQTIAMRLITLLTAIDAAKD